MRHNTDTDRSRHLTKKSSLTQAQIPFPSSSSFLLHLLARVHFTGQPVPLRPLISSSSTTHGMRTGQRKHGSNGVDPRLRAYQQSEEMTASLPCAATREGRARASRRPSFATRRRFLRKARVPGSTPAQLYTKLDTQGSRDSWLQTTDWLWVFPVQRSMSGPRAGDIVAWSVPALRCGHRAS
jgi:hypothetical protein